MKILIVGFGSIGKRHLTNLATLGCKDFHILTEQDLTGFTLGEGIQLQRENGLEEALAHSPDAVFVCNPTALHVETALKAARAGAAVFLEKPVSHNLDGLHELEDLAKQMNLKIQVGFQFRYHPVFQAIRKIIADGKIGQIISAHAFWGEWLPGWHPWEDYRQGYSARRDLGGGVVLTLCHPFDYLRWMLGEMEVVSAVGGKLSELEINTEDTALVTLRFDGGAIGMVYLDYVARPSKHTLQIIGTEGRIEWDAAMGSAKVYHSQGNAFETLMPGRFFDRNELFLAEVASFLDCIQHDKTPACTLEDGIKALKICLEAKKKLAPTASVRPPRENAGHRRDFATNMFGRL